MESPFFEPTYFVLEPPDFEKQSFAPLAKQSGKSYPPFFQPVDFSEQFRLPRGARKVQNYTVVEQHRLTKTLKMFIENMTRLFV